MIESGDQYFLPLECYLDFNFLVPSHIHSLLMLLYYRSLGEFRLPRTECDGTESPQ